MNQPTNNIITIYLHEHAAVHTHRLKEVKTRIHTYKQSKLLHTNA